MTHTNYHSTGSGRLRAWITSLAIFLFSISLVACGGGDDDGTSGSNGTESASPGTDAGSPPPQSAGNGFSVNSDQEQTTPGGANITITASGNQNTGSVEWTLAPGSPGTLSRTTGSSVEYIPPPPGTAITNNVVIIIAGNGDVTNNVTIVLTPDTAANEGTEGADTVTPPAPPDDDTTTPPSVAPGIYLLAGNDFGAGMANGTGTSSRFDTPTGIARDGQGNLYVADRFNNVIRKITAQGAVTTLAGMPGARGLVDGAGSAARFSVISDVAVDSLGNIYVADYGNAAVRKITPDGTVSTLAGGPGANVFSSNPMGIAVDSSGNVYLSETNAVRKITPAGEVSTLAGRIWTIGAQDGPAVDARFTDLNGIAVDANGNVYVVDGGWGRAGGMLSNTFYTSASIRKITPDGTVSTLAGAGGTSADAVLGFADGQGAAARFRYPDGLTIDSAGNLFVGDRGNQAIRRVTPDGMVSTVAGVSGESGSADGAIADARFAAPAGIAVDADGVLYVTDSAHHTIRRIVPADSVGTLAGAAPLSGSADGAGSAASFNAPVGVTRDADGNIYVADTGNETIRRISPDGSVTTLAGSPGATGSADGFGSAARFNRPRDVAADAGGNVFVSDFSNRLIRRITPAGVVTTYAGTLGSGGYADGPAAAARFVEPQAVAVGIGGNVYVADRAGDTVRVITPQGVVSTFAGQNEDPDGTAVPFGSRPAADGIGSAAEFYYPQDIAADIAGNIYVIDSGSAIRKITPQAAVSTLAGVGFDHGTRDGTGAAARFNAPQALTVDDAGNVYVADSRAIRRITPLGVVTTVAGASAGAQENGLSSIHRPSGLVMTGPNSLVFTSGNGVFELRLP